MIDLPVVLAAVGGAAFTALYFTWRMKPTESQLETMQSNVVLTIIAGESLDALEPEQRAEVRETVDEKVEDAFGDEVAVSIGGDDE